MLVSVFLKLLLGAFITRQLLIIGLCTCAEPTQMNTARTYFLFFLMSLQSLTCDLRYVLGVEGAGTAVVGAVGTWDPARLVCSQSL